MCMVVNVVVDGGERALKKNTYFAHAHHREPTRRAGVLRASVGVGVRVWECEYECGSASASESPAGEAQAHISLLVVHLLD